MRATNQAGEVRDRRKLNTSDAHLSLAQQDCILELMYDEFRKRHHVNYDKVKGFAEFVRTNDDICSSLGIEPVDVA